VDIAADVGAYCRIVLDDAGDPAIAYYDKTNQNLKFAHRTGANVWSVERSTPPVMSASTSGWPSPPARSALRSTTPRMPTCDSRRTPGSWTVTNVETAGDVGSHASVTGDAEGVFHVSYDDVTNKRLRYARRDVFGNWTLETVDAPAGATVGQFTSIAINPLTGQPAIAYYDVFNTNLKLATRPTSAWSIETVNSTGDVGRFAALRFDAQAIRVLPTRTRPTSTCSTASRAPARGRRSRGRRERHLRREPGPIRVAGDGRLWAAGDLALRPHPGSDSDS